MSSHSRYRQKEQDMTLKDLHRKCVIDVLCIRGLNIYVQMSNMYNQLVVHTTLKICRLMVLDGLVHCAQIVSTSHVC